MVKTYPPDFEAFWRGYPRHVGKYEAFMEWRKLGIFERHAAEKALPKQAQAWQIAGTAPEFIVHACRWLKYRRFEDDFADLAVIDWRTTSRGWEAKGRQLGIDPGDYENFQYFRQAVEKAMATPKLRSVG